MIHLTVPRSRRGLEAPPGILLHTTGIRLDGWFVFAVARAGARDQLADGAAVRYEVTVTLAGRPFERVTVGVGFAGLPAPCAARPGPSSFARIAPPSSRPSRRRDISPKSSTPTPATTATTGRTPGSRQQRRRADVPAILQLRPAEHRSGKADRMA